ncbi:integration host factor subunit alpha [Bacteroidia bacterium]|nr:integration host factor subunit alpha [Bacteroidia bacterium]
MTIKRADLANVIRDQFGITNADAYKIVDLFFSEIAESLVRGEAVKVAGFGSFKILEKNARMGRNPKTGESKIISARRVASFKPSAEFRDKVGSN